MRRLLLSLLLAWPADAAVASGLEEQSQAAGARLWQTEERMAIAWAKHDALVFRRDQAQAGADAALASIAPLVPALIRAQRLPLASVLVAPVPPAVSLRGYAVLRVWTRHASHQLRAYTAQRDDLASQADAVAAALPRLAQLAHLQQAESAAVDRALQQLRAERQAARDATEEQAAAAARRAAEEAARATNVRAAVGVVTRPSAAGPGRGIIPVAGQVVRRWGEPTDGGPATGVTFRPPPGARVVAPCGGRVVFAAPFRSYGLLLILDCGGGMHAVLAGFGRIDATAGLVVPAGEVVGTMPSIDAANGRNRGSLYLELRRGGQPVDPGGFLGGQL